MVSVPTTRVNWPSTHRLILSQYPPIDLFDDLVDPRDWEALARAEARSNPRIYEEIGDLSLVPPERRVGGANASWVMAAFTHISPDRPSRFTDGSYGVYYAGDSFETALREHCFHMGRFYASCGSEPGWISQVRQLVGKIDADLTDLRGGGLGHLLRQDVKHYPAAQEFAKAQKVGGANGIVYPSQRHSGGECIAAFYPDVVSIPKQSGHFRYHWNGSKIDFVQQKSGGSKVFEL